MENLFCDGSLGRALGWSDVCDLAITCVHGEKEGQRCRGSYWMYQWHCCIQALADGNTPEAFFAHLTSAPPRDRGKQNRHKAGKDCPRRACLSLITAETR